MSQVSPNKSTVDESKIEQDVRAEAIARAKTGADAGVKAAEARGEAVITRTLLLERYTELFGNEQAQTYMEMSDVIAQWYERTTGNSADEFYSRYYEDVRKSAEADVIGDLEQAYNRIEPSNRQMTQADAQNFARMLSRKSEGDVRAAIREEGNKADRIAILNELYNLDPEKAQNVARAEMDVLFQQAGKADYTAEAHQRNMTEGKAKLLEAIKQKKDIAKAFYRPEVGYIDLLWGFAGNESQEYRDGSGLSHIIARRNLEGKDGVQFAKEVYKIIANGTFGEKYKRRNSIRINVEYEGMVSVIGLDYRGKDKTWLLTSFEKYKKSPDAPKEGTKTLWATQTSTTDTRTGMVAGDESNISQGWTKINDDRAIASKMR